MTNFQARLHLIFIPAHNLTFTKMTSNNRTGAAVVEAAIALPILILLIMGTIDSCHVIFLKQSLTIAAFEGARVTIVPGSTIENVQAQVQQVLSQRNVVSSSVVITPTNFASQPQNTLITVTVNALPQANGGFVSALFAQELSESVTMMKEY